MIEWIAYARIMLIILYRPEYNHSWSNKSFYTKIGLTQLRENSSNKMVKAILKEKQIAQGNKATYPQSVWWKSTFYGRIHIQHD